MASEKLDRIIRLMDFLNKDYCFIPHWGLPVPPEADGDNYRPERLFKFFRNGTMTYMGSGYEHHAIIQKPNIKITGIKPDSIYINKLYSILVEDAKTELKYKIGRTKINNIEFLLLKFNNIEFLNEF